MSCQYIRSRYSTPTRDAQQVAQEQLDEYYLPGPVSRSSSSYELSQLQQLRDAVDQAMTSHPGSRSSSRAPSLSPYDYTAVCSTQALAVTSPYASGANLPTSYSSRPGSRGATPFNMEEEARIRRRLRQRSIPPPPPPIKQEPAIPRQPRQSRGRDGRPPLPPPSSRVVASDYYKKYIKSIYEREPMFHDFYHNIPPEDRNFYNRDSIEKLKKDFRDMVSDKWNRKGCSDPTVEHDLAKKLYPWSNVVARDSEPASERLSRIHASRPRDPSPAMLPRLTVGINSDLDTSGWWL